MITGPNQDASGEDYVLFLGSFEDPFVALNWFSGISDVPADSARVVLKDTADNITTSADLPCARGTSHILTLQHLNSRIRVLVDDNVALDIADTNFLDFTGPDIGISVNSVGDQSNFTLGPMYFYRL